MFIIQFFQIFIDVIFKNKNLTEKNGIRLKQISVTVNRQITCHGNSENGGISKECKRWLHQRSGT